LKPRFQADADLHSGIVAGVLQRESAIDFQSARELIPDGMPDPDVLRLAAMEDRILVSHDVSTMPRHFGDFVAANGNSPGLLLIAQSIGIGSAIEELVLVWTASDASEWRNLVVRLPL
jgi:Domain of unknown function (DUF5615)